MKLIITLLVIALLSTQSIQQNVPPTTDPATSFGIPLSQLPQFILISIDDALHAENVADLELFRDPTTNQPHKSHKNGNTQVPFTFYVSGQYSSYEVINAKYNEGNEIAFHTASHNTNQGTSASQFLAELQQGRADIVSNSGVPESAIVGFRAPLLSAGSDTFKALYQSGFLYDSSVPEIVGAKNSASIGSYQWPYTLDTQNAQSYFTGHLPDQSIPGLFELPLYGIYNGNSLIDAMDVHTTDQILIENLQARLDGNKAPFGLHYHHSIFEAASPALNNLTVFALQRDDVFFVTSRQLVEYLKNPVPYTQLASQSYMQPHAPVALVNQGTSNGQVTVETHHRIAIKSNTVGSTQVGGTISYPIDYFIKDGQSKTFTFAANSGFRIGEIRKNGAVVVNNGSGSITFSSVTTDQSLEITFVPAGKYLIRSFSNLGCSIAPADFNVVDNGSQHVYTVTTANQWCTIDSLTVDGAAQTTHNSHTFSFVQADHEISAHCTCTQIPTFTVTVETTTCNVTPASPVTVQGAQGVVLHFTTQCHHGEVTSILDNDVAQTVGSSHALTNVLENHHIIVECDCKYYVYTQSTECDLLPNGTVEVNRGNNLAFTVAPTEQRAGCNVDSVSVDSVSQSPIVSPFQLNNIQSNRHVNVACSCPALNTHLVTVNSINCNVTPGTSNIVNDGSSITLHFSHQCNHGSVSSITHNGSPVDPAGSLTISNVTQNHTVDVVCHCAYYIYTASNGCSLTPSGQIDADKGSNHSFAVAPISNAAGCSVTEILLDNVAQSTSSPFNLNNVSQNHNLNVKCECTSSGGCSGIQEFVEGNSYTGGTQVQYQSHKFQAKWWTTSVPNAEDQWGPWSSLGSC